MKPKIYLHYPKDRAQAVKQVYECLLPSEVTPWIDLADASPEAWEHQTRTAFLSSDYWVVFSAESLSLEDVDQIASVYDPFYRPGLLGLVLLENVENQYQGLSFFHHTAKETASILLKHITYLQQQDLPEKKGATSLRLNLASDIFINGMFIGSGLTESFPVSRYPATFEVFHWTKAPIKRVVTETQGSIEIHLEGAEQKPTLPTENLSFVDLATRARADLATGRYSQVRSDAQKLRQVFPQWEVGWILEANCAMMEKEYSRAAFYLDTAKAVAPDSFLPAWYHALCLVWREDLKNALDELDAILSNRDQLANCKAAGLTGLPATDPFGKRAKELPETKAAYASFCTQLAQISDRDISAMARPVYPDETAPLHLHTFNITHFQRFKQAGETIPYHPWIFLTGDNGEGKTSLLQALAIAFYGLEKNQLLKQGNHTSVQACFLKGRHPVTGDYRSQQGILRSGHAPLFGYGPVRLNLGKLSKDQRNMLYDDPIGGLLDHTKELLNIEDRLIGLQSQINACQLTLNKLTGDTTKTFDRQILQQNLDQLSKEVDRIKDCLITLLPQIDDIRISFKDSDGEIFYTEKGMPMKFQQLSAGHRAIISLVGDLIIRLTRYQRAPLSEIEAVVLIDELENHLHPKRQYNLPRQLSTLFPRVQFIVSTHSPMPLLGAPENAAVWRIDHEDDDPDKEAVIKKQELDLNHLQPNNILSSPAFLFHDYLEHAGDVRKIKTEASFGDIIKNNRLDEILKWADINVTLPNDLAD